MTIVQLDKDCLKALIEGNGEGSADLSQLHAKDTELTNRVNVLEEAKPVVENKLTEIEAKNTAQDEKITALENRTDNFVNNVAVSKEGKKVKLTYTRVDGTSSEVEFEDSDTVTLAYDDEPLKARIKALEDKPDKDTIYNDTEVKAKNTEQDEAINALKEKTKSFLTGASLARQGDVVTLTYTNIDGTSTNLEFSDHDTKALAYDDTALKTRVQELENKTDKDTVYDDAPIKARISALESKEDKDTKYNVKSATEGVTVTKSEEANETVFTVNADEALKNRTTTEDVKKLIEENNKRTAKVTLTHGTYIDESGFTYGFDDRKPEFVYNDVTHFGTFKVDGFIKGHLENHGVYLASMPEGSPKPLSLLEFLVYINNKPVNVWLDTSGHVRANGITDDMIGQRIVVTFVGLFV